MRINKDTCNSGKKMCINCMGDGKVPCPTCEGKPHSSYYIRFTKTN